MKKPHHPTLFLLLALTCLSACRTHQKTAALHTPNMVEETAFYTSCYPIESITVPSCKIDISIGNQSFSLTGSIYIRSDSVFYFRGRMIVEAIRGAVYRDSFVIVNILERICYKGRNDYLQRVTGYPITPESLMMLFTADRCEEVYRNRFGFTVAAGTGDRILMQGTNRSMIEMNLNANDRTMEGITFYNNLQRQPLFSAAYGNYNRYPPFVLPTVFDISAHDGGNPIRIKADFRQILFNQSQPVNINIPTRYEVVVLQ
jgi:hypothetical protein